MKKIVLQLVADIWATLYLPDLRVDEIFLSSNNANWIEVVWDFAMLFSPIPYPWFLQRSSHK
jgi:hypothetical protein